jgi:wobble nucleotide-excising tRNase
VKKSRCAAEKRFSEIETSIRREKRNLEAENNLLKKENGELAALVNSQKVEIEQLNQWINRLLEYTELSKEDIEQACKSDKSIALFGDMMRAINRSGFISSLGY